MKSRFVSLHPYFKIQPGKTDAVKASLPRFVEKSSTEKEIVFYEFSISGDQLFCREGYESANGLLAHLDNVSELLAALMKIADLTRLEVHGPAEELAKLKAPLDPLSPVFFELV